MVEHLPCQGEGREFESLHPLIFSLLCLIRLESNFYRSLPFLSTSFPLTSFSLSSLLPFRVIVNINLLVLVVYRDILFILNSTSQYCLRISLLPLSSIYFHLDIPLYSLFYLKKTMLSSFPR